jgi:glycosyltransferase involved in cell wall biosynthesis
MSEIGSYKATQLPNSGPTLTPALECRPSVSVVIPAYNAADSLPYLLAALLPQLGPEDQCIVVDDHSSDDTQRVSRDLSVTVLQTPRRSGPAAARNLGAQESKGEVLVFLDADVEPHCDVIERFRKYFRDDPTLTAVMGSYDDRPSAPGIVSRYRNLLHRYTHLTASRYASTFWTGCGAIRRERFQLHRGFDERRYPRPSIEDIEFGVRLRRAGEGILLDAAICVQHRKAWNLTGMLRTDIVARAVPWWKLILESESMPNDLNLKISQRLSAGFVLLSIAGLPLLLWKPAVAAGFIAVCVFLVIALNAGFYSFLAKHAGWRTAIAGIPLHFLYFLSAGIGLLIAVAKR